MLIVLSLLIPIVIVAIWIFLRTSPKREPARPVRGFNAAAVLIGFGLAAVMSLAIRDFLVESNEARMWSGIVAFYVGTLFPLWLAIAGGVRYLIFRSGPPAKLEMSRKDLTNMRI